MRQFKVSDVRLRGRGFTLFAACNNQNVSQKYADAILWAMNISAGTAGKDCMSTEKQMSIEQSDPILPNIITKEDFINVELIGNCLEEELIEESGDNYQLTEKMVSVLEEAAKIQKKLDNEGFHFCPCSMW